MEIAIIPITNSSIFDEMIINLGFICVQNRLVEADY